MANHESDDEWRGPTDDEKSKQDHFAYDCVTSTTQSTINNEDIDWEAASSMAAFTRPLTTSPTGLGPGVLQRPETPGRIPCRGRGLLFTWDTPSPTPGAFYDIDPWEREVTSTDNVSSWGCLASKRETTTTDQLDLCDRIQREHEAGIRATRLSEWERERYRATQWYVMELELLRQQYNLKMGNIRRWFEEDETFSD
jgi:hypothetical protein